MAEKIKLAGVILLAAVLGFFRISRVPPALSWDEAAIGWNAKTIWEMHVDEFGTRWPISFRSFADYKAPLYIYLTAPVVGVWGSSEISVRLVSVIAGIMSIVLIYLIGLEMGNGKLGFTAALLLAISPWHLLLSRPGFEASLALTLILAGIWLFKLALIKPPRLILAALSFAASMYSYQSPKIFVPAFVFGLLIIYRRTLQSARKWLIIAGIIAGIIVYPLVKDGLGDGGQRFKMTSIFYQPEVNLPAVMVKNYFSHWSPRWLFLSGGDTGRSQMSRSGMLLAATAPFLVIGLLSLWRRRKETWAQGLFWWLLTAPIPAMIGFEAPHAIRSYQLLPALILVTALGVSQVKKYRLWLWLAVLVNAVWLFYLYFTVYPVEAAPEWQYGYKEAAALAREWEDRVDKIIFSSYYGQPYIFTYWYQDRRPQSIFWGGAVKYLFRPVKIEGDKLLPNVLIIGSPADIPEGSGGIIKEIYFPDGQVAFRIVKT
jgi:4-amino-4-deoxy-L-arabinose transferase-like glycosyltransferase